MHLYRGRLALVILAIKRTLIAVHFAMRRVWSATDLLRMTAPSAFWELPRQDHLQDRARV
jgi:hypothetical protein